MPLWMAIVLLVLAVTGIVLSCKLIPRSSKARTPCVLICVLLALVCAAYIGLTLLFVDAVSNQPPTVQKSSPAAELPRRGMCNYCASVQLPKMRLISAFV